MKKYLGLCLTLGLSFLSLKATETPILASSASISDKITYSHEESWLQNAKPLNSEIEVLRLASEAASGDRFYLVVGVYGEKAINSIATLNPNQSIYGFDTYQDASNLPHICSNVSITSGRYDKTIPAFKESLLNGSPLALLYLGSDTYDTCVMVLENLEENIVNGTIVVFEGFYNYPEYIEHEFKALNEFLAKRNLAAEYLAYNVNHTQVAVRITEQNNPES